MRTSSRSSSFATEITEAYSQRVLGEADQKSVADAVRRVELYERLVGVNPLHRPELSDALIDLAAGLSAVGEGERALTATLAAIDIARSLGQLDRSQRILLARALSLQAKLLTDQGKWDAAIEPAEEAARIRHELAGDDPSSQHELSESLLDLGLLYGKAGRGQEAVPPTEEAVRLYRGLALNNSDHLPGFVRALTNLGNRYSEVGRRQDALAPTEEAVQLYRGLARDNPAFVPRLASALTNLGSRYSELGRRQDALALTEEAVQLYRGLARDNPAFVPGLASALTNLGVFYSEVARHQDAVALTEEATELRRSLARDDPAFLPDLAKALTNLGISYSAIGGRADALVPTEEAVTIYRQIAADNPAFLPDLARALTNLGNRYSELGRRQHALAPTEEAADLYRVLAQDNPVYLPGLALALNNLGAGYSMLGQHQDALPPAREAVQLYRGLALDNPAYLPDLARALTNLGAGYSMLGQHQDALPPAREAVQLYRGLALDNPAFLSDLARALTNLGNRRSELGQHQDALPSAQEAVQLYRGLALDNPAFLSDLARALTNLGNRRSELGQHQDALPPAQEAVQLYRGLALDNPAFLSDLARALTNLGNRRSELGQHQDALPPAQEAVQLYRGLALDNPAFLSDLARALTNLGNRRSELGQHQDALPPAQEAVQLYRGLALDNPVYLPGLARALTNLGNRHSELGQHQDALPPAQEAARIYRDLGHDYPAFLPDLAQALTILGNRCREAGEPERGDVDWEEAIADSSPASAAFLLAARAAAADPGHPGAVRWLSECLELASGDRSLTAAIHDQARRHWAANPAVFSADWQRLTGQPVPLWLTVDASLLTTAKAWIATNTVNEEREFLSLHLELLDPIADDAVSEALLSVSEDTAQQHTALRQAARATGVEAAYRPLLLTLLAHQFSASDLGEQRSMLVSQHDDLLSSTVRDTINSLARENNMSARRAKELLDLAALEAHEAVISALMQPDRLPSVLHGLACRPDPAALAPAAMAALTIPSTPEQTATITFYLAVAAANAGESVRADELLSQVRRLGLGQEAAWIDWLADIGRQHPPVLALIPALTRPQEERDEQVEHEGSSKRGTGHTTWAPGQRRQPGARDGAMQPGSDLVVVLPGIVGSQLRQDGRLVWGPSAGHALRAITSFSRAIKGLRLPDGIGDDHPGDTVESAGVLPDFHVLPGIWAPVKGYDKLLNRLRSLGYTDVSTDPGAPPGNLLPLGYDWRLSNRWNGRWIAAHLEPALERWRAQGGPYSDAQLVFVCHSMGGLVARWYIELCGGAEITRRLITFGTPYRGAARALIQLVNGAGHGLGPLTPDLTSFARSLPSLYQLMPEYACIDRGAELVKTTETSMPGLDSAMIADAMRFHMQIRDAETARADSLNIMRPIVGTRQPTPTTVRITEGRAYPVDTYGGHDLGGDGVVPLPGACRADMAIDSPLLRRVPDKHGNLHQNSAALDELEEILTAKPIGRQAAAGVIDIAIDVPELILAGEQLPVEVSVPGRQPTAVTVTDETGQLIWAHVAKPSATTIVDDLAPGVYTVRVNGVGLGNGIAPVSSTVLVWDPTTSTIL